MDTADAEVAAYIGRWRPSSVSPEAAAFARQVVPLVAPAGQERAKNLLWAAGKLADYAIGLGLDPVPDVVLHPSVAERFTLVMMLQVPGDGVRPGVQAPPGQLLAQLDDQRDRGIAYRGRGGLRPP